MTPLALCEFPLHRCLCTRCVVMSTPRECICCKEIVEVVNKLSEVEHHTTSWFCFCLSVFTCGYCKLLISNIDSTMGHI